MKDLNGIDLKAGDFVLPLNSPCANKDIRSAFGLIIAESEVFIYNEQTQRYGVHYCNACLKVDLNNFSDKIKEWYKHLSNEYNKYQMKPLKYTKAGNLKLGQVFKREYRVKKIDKVAYYVYLGAANISVTSVEDTRRLEKQGSRVYLVYSDVNSSNRPSEFKTFFDSNKSREISFEELIFNTSLSSDVRQCKDGYNRMVLFSDIFEVRDMALTRLVHIGDISISDFKNSNKVVINTAKWPRKTVLWYENEYYYLRSLYNFVLEFNLIK